MSDDRTIGRRWLAEAGDTTLRLLRAVSRRPTRKEAVALALLAALLAGAAFAWAFLWASARLT